MRKINFADHLEKKIAIALDSANIEFVHESENKYQVTDFYVPEIDCFIEVKQYHTDRTATQLQKRKNDSVILLQGEKAVDFFVSKIGK